MSVSLLLWSLLVLVVPVFARFCDDSDDDDGDDSAIVITNASSTRTSAFRLASPSCTPRHHQNGDNGGLSKGAIAGIAVAAVVGVLGLLLVCFELRKRRKRSRNRRDIPDIDPAPAPSEMRMRNGAPPPALGVFAAIPTSPSHPAAIEASTMKALPPTPASPQGPPLSHTYTQSYAGHSSISHEGSSQYLLHSTPPMRAAASSSSSSTSPLTRPTSSSLHSEMLLHQKDLQLQQREHNLEAADPPPSYELVSSEA
ncbi:hypothetical protein DENSPDRAFT_205613 [Dentipellis sp. KUC8613]|nr:hypothetical protein DENSPDRAFT_205613 [Dentipellis sp. KUC8613]